MLGFLTYVLALETAGKNPAANPQQPHPAPVTLPAGAPTDSKDKKPATRSDNDLLRASQMLLEKNNDMIKNLQKDLGKEGVAKEESTRNTGFWFKPTQNTKEEEAGLVAKNLQSVIELLSKAIKSLDSSKKKLEEAKFYRPGGEEPGEAVQPVNVTKYHVIEVREKKK